MRCVFVAVPCGSFVMVCELLGHCSCARHDAVVHVQPPFFRERCAEDDFQLAVQSLGIGHGSEGESKDDGDGDVVTEAGGDGHDRPRNGAAPPTDKKGDLDNGFSTADDGEAAASIASAATGRKHGLPPAEHPLQKVVTSLDMALGELNQLVHLIDLARAGEFMALERVTPTEEDQARAMSQSVSNRGANCCGNGSSLQSSFRAAAQSAAPQIGRVHPAACVLVS